jgi:hypothetical protein
MFIIIGTFFLVLFMLVLGFIGESIVGFFSKETDTVDTLIYEDNELVYSSY